MFRHYCFFFCKRKEIGKDGENLLTNWADCFCFIRKKMLSFHFDIFQMARRESNEKMCSSFEHLKLKIRSFIFRFVIRIVECAKSKSAVNTRRSHRIIRVCNSISAWMRRNAWYQRAWNVFELAKIKRTKWRKCHFATLRIWAAVSSRKCSLSFLYVFILGVATSTIFFKQLHFHATLDWRRLTIRWFLPVDKHLCSSNFHRWLIRYFVFSSSTVSLFAPLRRGKIAENEIVSLLISLPIEFGISRAAKDERKTGFSKWKHQNIASEENRVVSDVFCRRHEDEKEI